MNGMLWSRRRQPYGESKTGTRESKMDQIKVLVKNSLAHHNSVELFDSIPQQYKDAAAQLHMIFMDRSVGGNIDEYLN